MPVGFTGVNNVQPFGYANTVRNLNRSKGEKRVTTKGAPTRVNHMKPGPFKMFPPGSYPTSLHLPRSKRSVINVPVIPTNNSRLNNIKELNELHGRNIVEQNYQTRRASRPNNPFSGFFSEHKKNERLTPNSAVAKAQKSHLKQTRLNRNIPVLGLPVYKFNNSKTKKRRVNTS